MPFLHRVRFLDVVALPAAASFSNPPAPALLDHYLDQIREPAPERVAFKIALPLAAEVGAGWFVEHAFLIRWTIASVVRFEAHAFLVLGDVSDGDMMPNEGDELHLTPPEVVGVVEPRV